MTGRNTLPKAASRLRIAVLAMLAFVLAVWLVSIFGIPLGPGVQVTSHARESGSPYAPWISTVSVGLFALALLRLSAMLKSISAGDRFSRAVTRPFRDFAVLLLLSSLAGLLLPAITALLALNGDGPRHLQLRLELRDAIFVLASLVLFLIARMLEQAARIEAELEEIV